MGICFRSPADSDASSYTEHLLYTGLYYCLYEFFYLFVVLEWNQVHYYCGHLLTYCTSPGGRSVGIVRSRTKGHGVCLVFCFCTSPGWQIMVVEQLVECGRGNGSTRRMPEPVPLCPPQILHDFTQARTQATVVGSRHLSARAKARPYVSLISIHYGEYFTTEIKWTWRTYSKSSDFNETGWAGRKRFVIPVFAGERSFGSLSFTDSTTYGCEKVPSKWLWRMVSSEMLRRVVLTRTTRRNIP
jgi:hypothetical protein